MVGPPGRKELIRANHVLRMPFFGKFSGWIAEKSPFFRGNLWETPAINSGFFRVPGTDLPNLERQSCRNLYLLETLKPDVVVPGPRHCAVLGLGPRVVAVHPVIESMVSSEIYRDSGPKDAHQSG